MSQTNHGAIIRGMRLARGMTLRALAGKMRIQESYLSRIERGGRPLTLNMFIRAADALDCDISLDMVPTPEPRQEAP